MEASKLAGGKGRRHNLTNLNRRNKPVVEYMWGREEDPSKKPAQQGGSHDLHNASHDTVYSIEI